MLLVLSAVLLSLAGAAPETHNCTLVRVEGSHQAAAVLKEAGIVFQVDDYVHMGMGAVNSRLLWEGKREGLSLKLYEASSDDESVKGLSIQPTMTTIGTQRVAEVLITMRKGLPAAEAQQMVQSIATTFASLPSLDSADSSNIAAGQTQTCLPASSKAFLQDQHAVLAPYTAYTTAQTYDPKFPGWFGCFLCATTLGVTLPVVMNFAVAKVFDEWCEAQGGTEDYCENASLAVVLAMEMPIIFVGGAVVYEVCFMDRDCTPSSSSIEAPVLELAQKQKQTTLF